MTGAPECCKQSLMDNPGQRSEDQIVDRNAEARFRKIPQEQGFMSCLGMLLTEYHKLSDLNNSHCINIPHFLKSKCHQSWYCSEVRKEPDPCLLLASS